MENISQSVKNRKNNKIIAKYGVSFLDDCLLGIGNNDFVLIGADSGAGKTELALKIATSASKDLRVQLFSLEAEPDEMVQREDYKQRAEMFYNDPDKEPQQMGFRRFYYNQLDLDKYEEKSVAELSKKFKNITETNKGEGFGITDLTRKIGNMKDECDILIIDHIDYFDLDTGDDENTHMTKLMKELRKINQIHGIVIIAISHLRKRGKSKSEIPMVEDFIGSSNKYKQVKTVIMFSPDSENYDPSSGMYGTYVYSPKGRAGGSDGVVARLMFDRKVNDYKQSYELYRVNKFGLGKKIPEEEHPTWSRMKKGIENVLSWTDSEKRRM